MDPFVVGELEPKKVFRFFEELSHIPRESGHTAAASAWVEKYAEDQGLRCRRDELGNVVIWKDAAPGYEDHPAVMIQGHLDMVCVQDDGTGHDFRKDPLELYVDGDWIKARGTTLGGDDGAAVAMALAVLDDDAIPHPPVEVLLTVDEEIGLLGATGLKGEDLKARMLINLDSEDEGVLTVGCAGGARCDLTLAFGTAPAAGMVCTLTIKGLAGGHSGACINMGYANADKLLADCLDFLGAPRLASLHGGEQDNAIPNQAEAVVVISEGETDALGEKVRAWLEKVRGEYPKEKGMDAVWSVKPGSVEALTAEDSRKAVEFIQKTPNGVQAMEPDLPDQVQTSLNLGMLSLENGALALTFCVRSSSADRKEGLCGELKALTEDYGGSYSQRGAYPPWEYRKNSRLRDVMVQVFREQYGRDPEVKTIHAGLECGILAEKLPGLDAVSIGPDLMEIHSPRERMSISSVQRTWKYLLGVLAEL